MYLKKSILIIITILSLSGLAKSETSFEKEFSETQSVIESQIQAFLDENAELAYSFAAPLIKMKFTNPIEFMSMVKNYYEPVYNPKQFYFLEAKYYEGAIYHQLQVISQKNESFLATYSLIQDEGRWKISGCAVYPMQNQSI
ncbi:DUF4864 domain-containing protein [Alphaproteobacteria bacterium]|nr:DUF4864 domain-containing protein [Alphaproteobacteria bacterium]